MNPLPLENLNDPQHEAVCYEGGPLLVLAGAGSGKTRVVTYRIARLIQEKGIHPGRILAVTFTNKAAREMTSRIESLVGDRAKGLWIGTFHSMCTRMLRHHADRIGYRRDFSIYDADDQKALLKRIVKDLQLDPEIWNPGKVHSRISHAKNHLVSPEKMAAEYRGKDAPMLARVYEVYQDELRDANAMDFDDLLNNTVVLFADCEDVRARYQIQFEHVLVDEYQDTNEPQHIITRVLAQPLDNLCVVGDDDQSIYRWRGAQFKNILELPKIYRNLKVVRLEQNYRSTPNILSAAKSVISRNKDRHQKDLWTDRGKGDPIHLVAAETEEDEAFQVVQLVGEAVREGVPPSDVGILYRVNAQSRVLEEALMRQKVPFRIVGGFAFYQRREVKVLLSYMKMLIHPHDDLSFLRVVNNPRRGIGQTTLRQLQAKAGSLKISLYETAKSASAHGEIGGAGARKLQQLCQKIQEWAEGIEERPLSKTLSLIIDEIDYKNALLEEDKVKGKDRAENVGELVGALIAAEKEITYEMCRPWDTLEVERTPTRVEKLEVFLERVTLQSSREEDTPEENAVSLMTLHSAKGLEFSRVFITGMEEGLFPHEQSMDSPEEIEEERRLCYVGMTRAKDRLILCYAHNRRLWGPSTPKTMSRFLKEIPPKMLKPVRVPGRGGVSDLFSDDAPFPRSTPAIWSSQVSPPSPASRRPNQPSKETLPPQPGATAPDFLEPGKMVRHRTFGLGRVLKVEAVGSNWRVTVDFKIVGPKTLVQKYAKLEPA